MVKSARLISVFIANVWLSGCSLQAADSSVTGGQFDSNYSADVSDLIRFHASALLSDQRLLLAGQFDREGKTQIQLRGYRADGARDDSFHELVFDGAIRAIGVDAGDNTLVGGAFIHADSIRVPGLVRINAQGIVDPAFRPFIDWAAAVVNNMLLQRDGRILLHGEFQQESAGEIYTMLRLHGSGEFDASFEPHTVTRRIKTFLELPDGKVIIGGGLLDPDAGRRYGLARLNLDGSFDPTFQSLYQLTEVRDLVQLDDGRILAAGWLYPTGDPREAVGLARLFENGAIDSAFRPVSSWSGSVEHVAGLSKDRIMIGGRFAEINGIPQPSVARLEADGELDLSFYPEEPAFPGDGDSFGKTRAVDLHLADSGDVLVMFEQGLSYFLGRLKLAAPASPSTVTVGARSPSFFEEEGPIEVVIVRRGDAVEAVSVGYATEEGTAKEEIDFTPVAGIAAFGPGERLQSLPVEIHDDAAYSGARGFSFRIANPEGAEIRGEEKIELTILDRDRSVEFVREALRVHEADGSFSVSTRVSGGIFDFGSIRITSTDGTARAGIDFGEVDEELRVGAWIPPIDVKLFDNRIAEGPRTAQLNIEALNQWTHILTPEISFTILDNDFPDNPGFATDDDIKAAVVLPDGGIVIGGIFRRVNGAPQPFLAELNPNGSRDEEFAPELNGLVDEICLYVDGRILVGGEFTQINGMERRDLARLHPNGELDETFQLPGPISGDLGTWPAMVDPDDHTLIDAIAVERSGTILVGGHFEQIDGIDVPGLARLTVDGAHVMGFPKSESNKSTPSGEARVPRGSLLEPLSLPVRQLVAGTDGSIVTVRGPWLDGSHAWVSTMNRIQKLNSEGVPLQDAILGAFSALTVDLEGNLLVAIGDRISRWSYETLTLDDQFSSRALPISVNTMAVDADGNILVAGRKLLSLAQRTGSRLGETTILRLTPEGEVDRSFESLDFSVPEIPSTPFLVVSAQEPDLVSSLAILPGGNVFAAGAFTRMDGAPGFRFTILGTDGLPKDWVRFHQPEVGRDHLRLRINAPLNQTVVIERSTDLHSWDPIDERTAFESSIEMQIPIPDRAVFFRARKLLE